MIIISKRNVHYNRELEEASDSGRIVTIELWGSFHEPQRVAPTGKIPTPYPFGHGSPSKNFVVLIDSIETEYMAILQKYNINLHQTMVRALYTRGVDNSRDTLILISNDGNMAGGLVNTWGSAASEIYKLIEPLAEKYDLKFCVEICNSDLMARDISTAIKPNTLAHSELTAVQSEVEALAVNLLPALSSISYVMRGKADQIDNRRPTILIRVKPGSRAPFHTIQERLEEFVRNRSSKFELFVEIIAGETINLISNEHLPAPERAYGGEMPAVPLNGSSIGPQSKGHHAGSLGIWVDFHPHGKLDKSKCFLTCHSVVNAGVPDKAQQAANDTNGIGLNGAAITQHISIEYPANGDANATSRSLDAYKAEGNELDENEDRVLKAMKKHSSGAGVFGKVIHSSGNTVGSTSRKMDWAIVELNDQTLDVKNKPPIISPGSNMLSHAKGPRRYRATPNDVVTKVGTIAPDDWQTDWACKLGRTSDITAGEINKLDTYVQWDDGSRTRETVIFAIPEGQRFAQRGDSGAMVFNLQMEWVGMVTKGEAHFDQGYILLAQEIIDDIKDRTGGIVTIA